MIDLYLFIIFIYNVNKLFVYTKLVVQEVEFQD